MLHLLTPPPKCYYVLAGCDEIVYGCSGALSLEDALDVFEDEKFTPGKDGIDSSWNAVLNRIYGRQETPGKWVNSTAQLASKFFPVGSWKWVELMRVCRTLELKGGSNARSIRSTP